MEDTFDFALIRLVPAAHRGENINVGVVVLKADGADVRIVPPFSLLRYFNISIRSVEWIKKQIFSSDNINLKIKQRIDLINQSTVFYLSEPGWFSVDQQDDYERRISEIIAEYIDRPRSPVARQKKSSLHKTIGNVFREFNVFSKNFEDLDKHKVISNFPVGPSGKLYIDFMIKNGRYHATETLDFSRSESTGNNEIKQAAVVNVTFQHARERLNEAPIQCYLVYSAKHTVEKNIEPAISIAKHGADDIFNVESREDKLRYFNIILKEAGIENLFDYKRIDLH
jgi:hypothetical protein